MGLHCPPLLHMNKSEKKCETLWDVVIVKIYIVHFPSLIKSHPMSRMSSPEEVKFSLESWDRVRGRIKNQYQYRYQGWYSAETLKASADTSTQIPYVCVFYTFFFHLHVSGCHVCGHMSSSRQAKMACFVGVVEENEYFLKAIGEKSMTNIPDIKQHENVDLQQKCFCIFFSPTVAYPGWDLTRFTPFSANTCLRSTTLTLCQTETKLLIAEKQILSFCKKRWFSYLSKK